MTRLRGIIVAADLNHYKNDQMNRVYDTNGISPTVLVVSGGGREIKIIDNRGERMKTVSVNDFFCGAGGMGLGFKNAGFRLGGAWDFDKYAVESYGHNVSPKVKQADITQMTIEDIPHSDVWTFGFPCQDISIAGNKLGMIKGETRSGLFYEIMRLLDESKDKPKIILAENVKAVKNLIPEIEKEYNERGYKIYTVLYSSKYWGVPQSRDRYFMLGVHKSIEKEFTFPAQQTEFIPRLSTILENEVDEKYYMSADKTKSIIEQVENKLREKGSTENDLHGVIADPSQAKREGKHRIYTETSPTLSARDYKEPRLAVVGRLDMKVNEEFRVRKLTPREYARLQGFPDSYEQVVSNSQFYKQMGNAVTVNVAQAIAERIRMFLLSL
jgi:DNA (cytosine-5)-methyltransferase 1